MRLSTDKYNRQSIRLREYDYTQQGAYYVTICTQKKEHLFGNVQDGEMILNDAGQMIDKWWQKIPQKYNIVELDTYQIMPNHLHGIIAIVGADPRVRPNTWPAIKGQTHRSAPTPTVGTIIQWFKTMTTNEYIRNVKQNNWPAFDKRLWQRNYYEHVIRDDNDLNTIRQYIYDNPLNWDDDENNPMNIDKHLNLINNEQKPGGLK